MTDFRIRLPSELLEFLRSSDLGQINGQPLNSTLVFLQPTYNGIVNPMYGILEYSSLQYLIVVYWTNALKKEDGTLRRTSAFDRVFQDSMVRIINQTIDRRPHSEILESLRTIYTGSARGIPTSITFPGLPDIFSPNEITVNWFTKLFLDLLRDLMRNQGPQTLSRSQVKESLEEVSLKTWNMILIYFQGESRENLSDVVKYNIKRFHSSN